MWVRILSITAAVSFAVSGEAVATEYVLTNWNGKVVTLVDLDSVQERGDRKRFWSMDVSSPSEVNERGYAYSRSFIEVTCAEGRIRQLQYAAYAEGGDVVSQQGEVGAGEYVVPGSVGEGLVKPVCDPSSAKDFYHVTGSGWADPLAFAKQLMTKMPNPKSSRAQDAGKK